MKQLFLLVVLALSVLVIGCRKDDDEAMVRAVISQTVTYAEARDVKALFDLATDDFTANPGSRDRRESKVTVMMAFKRFGNFRVSHPIYPVNIVPEDKEATVRLPFLILKDDKEVPGLDELIEDPDRWAEQAAETTEPYYMNITLVKDGDWKISRVNLKGVRSLF